MQGAFQEFTTSAISRPATRQRRDRGVRGGDLTASPTASTAKGVTVYRDGSRDMQFEHRLHRPEGQSSQRSSGKAEARADLAQLAGVAAASGDRAAMERSPIFKGSWPSLRPRTTPARVVSTRGGEPAAPAEAPRPEAAAGHPPARDALGTLYVTITEDDRGQAFEVFMSPREGRRRVIWRTSRRWPASSAWRSVGIPEGDLPPAPRHQLRPGDRPSGPTRSCPCPTRWAIAIERWMQEKRAFSRSCCRGAPRRPEPPRWSPSGGGCRAGGEQQSCRRQCRNPLGRLSGLRIAARIRRGVHEVARVRFQRVRMIVVIRR